MSNTDVILSCLEANVANAKTKPLRAFAEEQLQNFKETLSKAKKPKPEMPASIARFLESFDEDEP
jgi:hypothetical protein